MVRCWLVAETLSLVNKSIPSEPPLWRVSRRLRGPLARRAWTRDGTKLLLYAYQKGIPPVLAPGGWDLAPAPIAIGQYLYLYLRYKVRYRSTYVFDIREPSTGSTLVRREVGGRQDAIKLLEKVETQLPTLSGASLPEIISMLDL